MKNCILIPSYHLHKFFINSFLFSLSKKTPCNLPIYIIVSNDDYDLFSDLIKKYTNMNISIINFNSSVLFFSQLIFNHHGLSKSIYQSLKKLYGLLHLFLLHDYDNVIIFDSECMVIRDFDIDTFISDYIKKPFLIYGTLNIKNKLHDSINKSTLSILKYQSNDVWMLAYYSWIYERKIFLDLLNYVINIHKTNYIEIFKSQSEVFFENIYFTFLYHESKNLKYNYTLINNVSLFSKCNITDTDLKILLSFIQPFDILEDCRFLVDNEKYFNIVSESYNKNLLTFYKSHASSKKSLDLVISCPSIKICVSEFNNYIFSHFLPDFTKDINNSIIKRCMGLSEQGTNIFKFVKNDNKFSPYHWIGFECLKEKKTYTFSFDIMLLENFVISNHCNVYFKVHNPLYLHTVDLSKLILNKWINFSFQITSTNNDSDLFLLLLDNAPKINILIQNLLLLSS